ncbi:MAG: hypothetical protein ACRDSK_09075 [Actinophytocola sp.]|uniref:hypothetical protein n=1 Tax=Actinophytocola sp. TaxID=1872138 RepID=UPI003D6A1F12
MERAARIPREVKVVVAPSRSGVVREHLPSLAVLALAVVAAGFGVAATETVFGGWAVIGLACVLGVSLELLVVRSELEPVLAADADHVWVRIGGFPRSESVRLDWSEITEVGLRSWQGRRRTSARYLTLVPTEPALAELARVPSRRQLRQHRRLAAEFGSPLAISGQHKAPSLDETVRGLRALAPDGVRFTES